MEGRQGDEHGGTRGPNRRAFPRLIALVIVTGGLVLIGAGRLFFFAHHHGENQPADQQATAVPHAQLVYRRGPGLPSMPRQTAAGGGPGTDDDWAGSTDTDDPGNTGDPPPTKIRLAQHGVSELVQLVRATTDRWLKADIIDELAGRREKAGIPTIAALLQDPDRDVRRVAANALAELDAEDQVAAVRAALATETDSDIRVAIQEALHELEHRQQ